MAALSYPSAFRGRVITAADADYDAVRKIWNGMIDRRPGMILRCAGAADVISAVNFARDAGLMIAVRGGGHSFPGHSVCDGGVMIDLQAMKSIRVDPDARRVRAEPGVTWGEFDAETQAFGLATTGGMVSHTGIAGLTLGGGFGWLMRKFGLVIDNLLAADVVTADGRLLKVSADQHPDLFWAIRGGGGNFGIVTSFEYRLHRLEPLLAGLIAYPVSQARQVVRGFHEVMEQAPDRLVAGAVLMTTPDGHQVVGVAPCFMGDASAGEHVVGPLRRLGTPASDQVGTMPYTAVQMMFNDAAVPGRRFYMRSNHLDALPDECIDALSAAYARAPSPFSAILIVSMGGAVSRVGPDATPYFHRQSPYTMTIFGSWVDARDDDANVSWVRETWSALAPYLGRGVYVNELHDEGADRVRAAYGTTYTRLSIVKQKYDPKNIFHLNQNIQPAD
jgi:FAD/FMN-containing dehydrogenase